MLFNSYEFLCLFLPLVLITFFFIAKRGHRSAELWLVLASLFFYGWWNPIFLCLLIASIVFNYGMGYLLGITHYANKVKLLLTISIIINLSLLGLFKYANFFIDTANSLGAQWKTLNIVLPLGISFFTFTQIAFLIDVYRGVVREQNFIHYLLFVTWFPHLIAGPVLHHKQMMPQFGLSTTYKPSIQSIAVGLTLFTFGLFKKVVFADQFALYANPVFDSAAAGQQFMFFEAWIGALAYTFQLYFDFSGYSDMAIGISRMFNINLPINFNSPYKATNIIDFWRRWHITLSTFLRDYLYIPLGGNRKGSFRRHLNIFTTMLLGGLWHGAGWNFLLWGGLHGIYLIINHGWRKLTGAIGLYKNQGTRFISMLLTFVMVVIAWVPFRATSMKATVNIWSAMFCFNGISFPSYFSEKFVWLSSYLPNFFSFNGLTRDIAGIPSSLEPITWIVLGLLIISLLPNTQQYFGAALFSDNKTQSQIKLQWRPTKWHALAGGILFAYAILNMARESQFLYFQF